MNLILLSGLSLIGASDSALKNVRYSMNPVIEYQSVDKSLEINVDEISGLMNSNDEIKAVHFIRKEMVFANSFEPLTQQEIQKMYDGGINGNSPNISVSGSYFVEMIQFESNEFSLINGRILEQNDFDQNLNMGLIEMELANKNNIAIGDKISLNICSDKEIENFELTNDQVQLEIEIIGIFKNNLKDDENTGVIFKPENTVFVSGNTVDSISMMHNNISGKTGLNKKEIEESKLKNNVLISLDNALLIDDFVIKNQNISNRLFNTHDEEYTLYSQNFIMLNLFGELIVSVICINVVIILILLITMKFYDRKKEIASMFCLGVSNVKLFSQLVIETLFIQFIGFVLSLLVFALLIIPANVYFIPTNNVEINNSEENMIFDDKVDYFSTVDYSDFTDNFILDINIEMIIIVYVMQVVLIVICEYLIFIIVIKMRIKRLME